MTMRARSVEEGLSVDELRALSEKQPNAHLTEFGSLDIITTVTSRSTNETVIVSDRPEDHLCPTITRQAYDDVAAAQDRHLEDADLVVLDGYIGDHPDGAMATRLIVEKSNANLAGMQQHLYFPAGDGFEPELTVIYTPNLPATGYQNERLVTVDLEAGVTRVLNSDYFGDSKMGGIRMWDAEMYRRGGLAFHSGLKVMDLGDGPRVLLIVGLSGTGKTTTTFSEPEVSRPSQDDFVALLPDGRVFGTEAGTFAKVYGLTPTSEPGIWPGAIAPDTYLENVAIDSSGKVDFGDKRHTENTRAIIAGSHLPGFLPPANIERADYILLLTRNENVVPAVSKLDREQAAAAFMLGESQGTSAGGASEAGKFLRIPGTNPFFAYRDDWQGNRFYELLQQVPLEVYLLNTGRVGGPEGDERSKNVSPEHTSAVVRGIISGSIQWDNDPTFGTLVASSVPGIDDIELLQPWRLYERQDRTTEYQGFVEGLREQRSAHLDRYDQLHPSICDAV